MQRSNWTQAVIYDGTLSHALQINPAEGSISLVNYVSPSGAMFMSMLTTEYRQYLRWKCFM